MESYQLNQTIHATADLLSWDESEVRAFWNLIDALPTDVKNAINPLDLGFEKMTPHPLGVFIAGLRTGLFECRWSVVCPHCGSVVESHGALSHFNQDQYTCPVCETSVPVDLDTTMETSFSPTAAYFPGKPDPFSGVQNSYEDHYVSARYLRHPELREYLKKGVKSFSVLGLWEFGKVSFKCKAGETFRVINMETRTALEVHVMEIPPPRPSFLHKMINHLETHGDHRPIQTIEADLKENGFTQKEVTVKPGRVELWVHNQTQMPVGLLVMGSARGDLAQVLEQHPPHSKKVLTGLRLITDQSFRDFLLEEGLPEDFRNPVSHLTLLFASLQGSLELYRTLGDEKAFSHLQNYYALTAKVILAHNGALVKTMGDQIMAVFSDPQEGFSAASAIQKALVQYNQKNSTNLLLQIALHEDRVLAVKANRTLDFFGSGVNKASKLLQCCTPGEIWVTEKFMEKPTTTKVPGKLGYTSVQQEVVLDQDKKEVVYQCYLAN